MSVRFIFRGLLVTDVDGVYALNIASPILPCPDFAGVARAFGAHAITVGERSELSDAMNETLCLISVLPAK